MKKIRIVKDNTHVDFIGVHKFSIFASFLMMIISIFMLSTKGLNYGIDFTGGLLVEVKMPKATPITEVREMLANISTGSPTIQEFGNNELMIKIPSKEGKNQKEMYKELSDSLGSGVEFRRVEYVGPQVGSELIILGLKAFFYSMLGIMAYIWFRFEWQFGLAGIIALVHDILAIMLFFSISRMEFDLSTVAAILMVAGTSINDTVVVFDRIRETFHKYRKLGLTEILNMAVNQTLSRTIMTSFTTIFALISLVFLGTEVIKSFAYVMLIGIFVGTYSSVFLASPLLIYMNFKRDSV